MRKLILFYFVVWRNMLQRLCNIWMHWISDKSSYTCINNGWRWGWGGCISKQKKNHFSIALEQNPLKQGDHPVVSVEYPQSKLVLHVSTNSGGSIGTQTFTFLPFLKFLRSHLKQIYNCLISCMFVVQRVTLWCFVVLWNTLLYVLHGNSWCFVVLELKAMEVLGN